MGIETSRSGVVDTNRTHQTYLVTKIPELV